MRKILLITGSRGEYGYIRPILRIIDNDPDLVYEIVATNMHLLPEFGSTIKEFENDGFIVKYKPTMTLAGYTPDSMMKSLSLFALSITDIISSCKPDIILLAGDRGEQFMAATAGIHMNIPVAHIQAGEVSGNVDGMTRHAIARYAHIHFASSEVAANRIIKTGEQEERVFQVGAPQLDEFIEGGYTSYDEMCEKYDIKHSHDFILCVQHPVTEEYTASEEQMSITLAALTELGIETIIIEPNSDAGTLGVRRALERECSPFIKKYRNVSREDFAALLKYCSVIVGNSSSGLLEAPTFSTPAVNIGRRQKGRLQAENVINSDHETQEIISAIRKAMSDDFKTSIKDMKNPYGDGLSSKRIVNILKSIRLDEKLLKKELAY